jgi:hypothetical protein
MVLSKGQLRNQQQKEREQEAGGNEHGSFDNRFGK